LPSVDALSREFRGQGLQVLLISFRESPDHVRRVVHERGMPPRCCSTGAAT
jgi:hypothetical protein